jgi:hypothetical protein
MSSPIESMGQPDLLMTVSTPGADILAGPQNEEPSSNTISSIAEHTGHIVPIGTIAELTNGEGGPWIDYSGNGRLE